MAKKAGGSSGSEKWMYSNEWRRATKAAKRGTSMIPFTDTGGAPF